MFSWTPRPGYAGACGSADLERTLTVTAAAVSCPTPVAWTLYDWSSSPSSRNGARAMSTARMSASTGPLPALWAGHSRPAPRIVRLARLERLLLDCAAHCSIANGPAGSTTRDVAGTVADAVADAVDGMTISFVRRDVRGEPG